MGKTVSTVIEKLHNKNQKLKQDILLNLGIYEKVYSSQESNEYPYSEYKDGQEVFYKIVTSPVSDEEWKKIIEMILEKDKLSHINIQSKENAHSSGIGSLMYISAFLIYIAGIIFGIFSFAVGTIQLGIIMFVSAFVSGSLFLGLGEIIELLNSK